MYNLIWDRFIIGDSLRLYTEGEEIALIRRYESYGIAAVKRAFFRRIGTVWRASLGSGAHMVWYWRFQYVCKIIY